MRQHWMILVLAAGCRTPSETDADSPPRVAPSSSSAPAAPPPPTDGAAVDTTASPEKWSWPPTDQGWITANSNDRRYAVAWRCTAGEVPLHEIFDLEVRVQRTDVEADQDLELDVDAAMPQHQHGMLTQAVVDRTGDGSFLVHGMQFHMLGLWQIYFDVTERGITERAQFDYELR